jgi:hypothetical protein
VHEEDGVRFSAEASEESRCGRYGGIEPTYLQNTLVRNSELFAVTQADVGWKNSRHTNPFENALVRISARVVNARAASDQKKCSLARTGY